MFSWISAHPWAYPALEVVHLLGLGLLLGNLVLLELRVLGPAPRPASAPPLPLPALARATLPLVLGGFGLSAASGLLMFASQPLELLANRVFTIKMGLLVLAGINAALFHARASLSKHDAVARFQALLSLGIWLAVIVCGRFIAYV